MGNSTAVNVKIFSLSSRSCFFFFFFFRLLEKVGFCSLWWDVVHQTGLPWGLTLAIGFGLEALLTAEGATTVTEQTLLIQLICPSCKTLKPCTRSLNSKFKVVCYISKSSTN